MISYPTTDLTDLFITQLKLTQVSFDWIRTYGESVLYNGKELEVKTTKLYVPWNIETRVAATAAESAIEFEYHLSVIKEAVKECDIKFAGGMVAIQKLLGPNIIWQPIDEFCPRSGLMIRFAWLKRGSEDDISKVLKKYGIEENDSNRTRYV